MPITEQNLDAHRKLYENYKIDPGYYDNHKRKDEYMVAINDYAEHLEAQKPPEPEELPQPNRFTPDFAMPEPRQDIWKRPPVSWEDDYSKVNGVAPQDDVVEYNDLTVGQQETLKKASPIESPSGFADVLRTTTPETAMTMLKSQEDDINKFMPEFDKLDAEVNRTQANLESFDESALLAERTNLDALFKEAETDPTKVDEYNTAVGVYNQNLEQSNAKLELAQNEHKEAIDNYETTFQDYLTKSDTYNKNVDLYNERAKEIQELEYVKIYDGEADKESPGYGLARVDTAERQPKQAMYAATEQEIEEMDDSGKQEIVEILEKVEEIQAKIEPYYQKWVNQILKENPDISEEEYAEQVKVAFGLAVKDAQKDGVVSSKMYRTIGDILSGAIVFPGNKKARILHEAEQIATGTSPYERMFAQIMGGLTTLIPMGSILGARVATGVGKWSYRSKRFREIAELSRKVGMSATRTRQILKGGASTATVFGTHTAIREALSPQHSVEEKTLAVMSSVGFGLGLGTITGGIYNPYVRIPMQPAYAYLNARLHGATNEEAVVDAAIFGIFAIAHRKNLRPNEKDIAYNELRMMMREGLTAKAEKDGHDVGRFRTQINEFADKTTSTLINKFKTTDPSGKVIDNPEAKIRDIEKFNDGVYREFSDYLTKSGIGKQPSTAKEKTDAVKPKELKPAEPIKPAEPTTPKEPIKPIEPVPTEPKPVEPKKPTVEKPKEPVKPIEPIKPVEEKPKEVETGKPYKAKVFRGVKEGKLPTDEGLFGKGTYFTTNKEYAGTYGKVTESEVELKNPFVINNQKEADKFFNEVTKPARDKALADGKDIKEADEIAAVAAREYLEGEGYDGVIARNIIEKGDEIVVFKDSKPKEAEIKPKPAEKTPDDKIVTEKPKVAPIPQESTQKPKEKAIPKRNFTEQDVKLGEITVDLENFQDRSAEFSKKSFDNIINAVENNKFRWVQFERPIVWEKKKGEKYIMLSGHTRQAALEELVKRGYTDFNEMPVRIFRGTFEEAKEIAEQSNVLNDPQTMLDNANKVRKLIKSGETLSKIDEKAKKLYGKDKQTILDLAHLTKGGKVEQSLLAFGEIETEDSRKLLTYAQWIGKAMKKYPEFKPSHETEMLNFVMEHGGKKVTNATSFLAYIEQAINRGTKLPGDVGTFPLNLNKLPTLSKTVLEYEAAKAEALKAVNDTKKILDKNRADYIKKYPDKPISEIDTAVKKFSEAYKAALLDYQRIMERDAETKGALGKQGALFSKGDDLTATQQKIINKYEKNPTAVSRIALPELLDLFYSMFQKYPQIKNMRPNLHGQFWADRLGGEGIKLNWRIAANEEGMLRTTTHEIGHSVDYLEDKDISGHALGKLLGLKHLKELFYARKGQSPGKLKEIFEKRRKLMRKINYVGRQARKGATKYKKLPIDGQMNHLKALLLDIEKDVYMDKKIRAELWTLSQLWRPMPVHYTDNHLKYRLSASELYADFFSAVLQQPALAKSLAPDSYEIFFNSLDKKPTFKKAFLEVVELTGNLEKLLKERGIKREVMWERSREAVETRELLMANSWWDWLKEMKAGLYKNIAPIQKLERQLLKSGDITEDTTIKYEMDQSPLTYEMITISKLQPVGDIVERAYELDIDDNLLGDYMFLARSATQRKDLFNPKGYSRTPSFQTIKGLRDAVGEKKYKDLQMIGDQIQDWWNNDILKYALDSDFISQKWYDKLSKGYDIYDKIMTVEEADALDAKLREVGLGEVLAVERFDEATAEALGELIDEDSRMVTIQEKSIYAPFIPRHHFVGSGLSAGIFKQRGTISEIMNPMEMIILKGSLMVRASEKNRIKKVFADHALQYYGQLARDGKSSRPITGEGVVYYKADGAKKSIIVPKMMAEVFNYKVRGMENWIVKGLQYPNSVFRSLIITFSIGFNLVNLPRDLRRTGLAVHAAKASAEKNIIKKLIKYYLPFTPTLTTLIVAKNYLKNIGTARSKARNEPDEKMQELIEEGVVFPNFSELFMQKSHLAALTRGEITGVEFELVEAGIKEVPFTSMSDTIDYLAKSIPGEILAKFLNALRHTSDVLETLPRPTAYQMLKGEIGTVFESDEQLKYFIRHQVGTPYYMLAGNWMPLINHLRIFFNIFVRGMEADTKLAVGQAPFKDPKAAGRNYRWVLFQRVFWQYMRYGLMAGAVGKLLQSDDEDDKIRYYRKAMQKIGNYEHANYDVFPVGMITHDGNVVPIWESTDFEQMAEIIYLRVPMSEMERVVQGITWNMLRYTTNTAALKSMSHILDFAADQVPTQTYVFQIIDAWSDYGRGKVPYDDFYDTPIVDERVMTGDRGEANKIMLKWTLKRSGLTAIGRLVDGYSQKDRRSATKQAVNIIPGLNRLVKISNGGTYDYISDYLSTEQRAKLAKQFKDADFINDWVDKYFQVRKSKDDHDYKRVVAQFGTEFNMAIGDYVNDGEEYVTQKEAHEAGKRLARAYWRKKNWAEYGDIVKALQDPNTPKDRKTDIVMRYFPKEYTAAYKKYIKKTKIQPEYDTNLVGTQAIPEKQFVEMIQSLDHGNILSVNDANAVLGVLDAAKNNFVNPYE